MSQAPKGNDTMEIERQIEKILEEKGVAPPGMTPEQFMQKFSRRFFEAIPAVLEKTADQIAKQIFAEDLERLGRREPCRFWKHGKPGRRCIQAPDCRECPSYQPRSRRWRWVRWPEFWEPVLIGLVLLSFVAAMFAEEIRVYVLCVWFGVVVMSRLHIWWMYRKLRKSKAI